MNYPKVAIIILNYNGWQDTIECLESVLRNNYPNYQVIVVDNGSPNNSMEYIKAWAEGRQEVLTPEPTHPLYHLSHPPIKKPILYIYYTRKEAEKGGNSKLEQKITKEWQEQRKSNNKELVPTSPYPLIFIQTGENLGFAGGNNVGIRYTLKKNTDAVLLINNDAILEPRSLEPAIKVLFLNEKVGIVGGKVKNYFKRGYIDSVGIRRILWPIGLMRSEGTGKLDRGQFEKQTELVATSGALMLIKRKIFNVIGLLSESFFFGGEDIDFCLSARKKGFKIIYEPQFIAHHKVGRSHSELTPGWIYNTLLSKQLIMKKHLSPFWWKVNRVCFWFYVRYRFLYRYKRRIYQNKFESSSVSKLLEEVEYAVRAAFRDALTKNKITLNDIKKFGGI